MTLTHLFFDLDDTIYPSSSGLWEAIRERMGKYMVERIGVPDWRVPALRKMYYEKYGTTLRGLQRHYQVDAEDYLNYVHDLALQDYLNPHPGLREMLESLPQRLFIFTNADSDHARRVLSFLDAEDCFELIIDVRAISFACKPEIEAYQLALKLAGDPPAQQSALIDDSLTNLISAHKLGFTTVLVGQMENHNPGVDYSIASLLQLPETIPELFTEC